MSGPITINQSVWFDLPVTNLADAMSFYEGLLGWTYQKMEDSPLSDYVMIAAGEKLIGGLRQVAAKARKEEESSGPILYFTVDHLDSRVSRAKELGAQIVGTRVDLGKGRGHYQWIRDRENHLIGLWSHQ